MDAVETKVVENPDQSGLDKFEAIKRTKEAHRLIQLELDRLGFSTPFTKIKLQAIPIILGDLSSAYILVDLFAPLPLGVSLAKLHHPDVVRSLEGRLLTQVEAYRGDRPKGFGWKITLNSKVDLPKVVRLDLEKVPNNCYVVPIGLGAKGQIYRSLPQLGNILIGGITRTAGKTNAVQVMLAVLLSCQSPEELKLAIVDLKQVDYQYLDGVPHLIAPLAHTIEDALEVLKVVKGEVDTRARLFSDPRCQAASLEEYNGYAERHGLKLLSRWVVVVDEFVPLVEGDGNLNGEFERLLKRLAATALAYGIHLILVTQHPKARLVDTSIRAECETRMAGHVVEAVHSRTILDCGGAELLPPIPGRMLVYLGGELVTVQGFWLPREDLKALAAKARDYGPSLSQIEIRLVQYARDELGEQFSIPKLEAAFGPAKNGGISARQLRKIAKSWERRGWLIPGPADNPTQARRLSSSFLQRLELRGDAPGRAGTQGHEISEERKHNGS